MAVPTETTRELVAPLESGSGSLKALKSTVCGTKLTAVFVSVFRIHPAVIE